MSGIRPKPPDGYKPKPGLYAIWRDRGLRGPDVSYPGLMSAGWVGLDGTEGQYVFEYSTRERADAEAGYLSRRFSPCVYTVWPAPDLSEQTPKPVEVLTPQERLAALDETLKDAEARMAEVMKRLAEMEQKLRGW